MESTTLPNAGCSRKRPSSSLCIGSVTSFMFGTACVVLEGDPVASKVEYCSCLAEGEDWAPFAVIRGHGEREAEEEPDASCAFLTSAKAAWHCSSDTFPTVANSQRTSLRSHDSLEDSDSFKDGEAYSTRPAVCHLESVRASDKHFSYRRDTYRDSNDFSIVIALCMSSISRVTMLGAVPAR